MGEGPLPALVLKRALLLLSGGIDSPVAGHLLQRSGFALEALHFGLEPFTDSSPETKSAALAAKLGLPRMHVCDAGPVFQEFTKSCPHPLYFVLSKRMMVRVASRVADDLGCGFLATGENLGQVSSQTLPNLAAIDAAAAKSVLRPLVAYDKLDIVRVAERIGTFEISKGPEMCDVLGPKHPETAAQLAAVEAAERKVDLAALTERALAAVRVREVAVPALA